MRLDAARSVPHPMPPAAVDLVMAMIASFMPLEDTLMTLLPWAESEKARLSIHDY